MRSTWHQSGASRCSPLDLPDLKTLLHKAGCIPARLHPGQRLPDIPPLPSSAIAPASVLRHPSILRRPDVQTSSSAVAAQRRVKFSLPPLLRSGTFSRSHGSDDADSDNTASHDFDSNLYGGQRIERTTRELEVQSLEYAAKQMVQRIPEPCLRELVDLGSLDRALVIYTRELGRLSIDSYQPFRSLYFYSVVMFHLGKSHPIDFKEAAAVCSAAVVLNNASSPITPYNGASSDVPGLLAFLGLGIDFSGSLTMSVTEGVALARSTWRSINQTCMAYALTAGRMVAHLDEPAVLGALDRHIARRCVIRPVYSYMFQSFYETGYTDLPVLDNGLQFQIYSTVREVMTKVHGPNLPLPYVMFTTFFAIIETNEKIVVGIAKAGGTAADICSTVYSNQDAATEDGGAANADSNARLSEPLSGKELLGLLDWDLAAAIGYLLAHRYHESDVAATKMRAKLGALAFGVDISVDQPFPPILPLQDTGFHQYIHNYTSAIYSGWPHGFVYMVIDEAVDAYNDIVQKLRDDLG
ncbi:hypothetical protein GGI04_003222 [Coemansia thaxteri]|nr:hypothetical protein GGI04_003222 [Coemansia thaxteri]KAJ2466031.1 hypothetical protein GGI02_004510 [Coemansia sp. RSA 2322]